jgi:alcohol dehydrogenase class IV
MMDTLKKNLELAGIRYAVFDGITGEPTIRMIADGADVYRKSACDFVIGLGGGSPLDAAKAISYMCVSTGKLSDYRGQVPEKEIPRSPRSPLRPAPARRSRNSRSSPMKNRM